MQTLGERLEMLFSELCSAIGIWVRLKIAQFVREMATVCGLLTSAVSFAVSHESQPGLTFTFVAGRWVPLCSCYVNVSSLQGEFSQCVPASQSFPNFVLFVLMAMIFLSFILLNLPIV